MGQQFLRRSESNPLRTAAFRDTRYTHRGENVERFGVPSGSKLNSQTGGCGDRPATGTETDAAISSDTPTRLPAFLSPSLFPPPIPNFSSTFLRRQAFRDFSTFHRYFFFFSTFLVFLFMPWEEKSLGRRPFSPETLRLHVRKRVAFQKRRVFFGSIDVTKNILRDNSHKILLQPDNRNTDGSVDRFRRMDRQRSARETRRNTAVTGFHERDGRFSEKRKNNFVESAFR